VQGGITGNAGSDKMFAGTNKKGTDGQLPLDKKRNFIFSGEVRILEEGLP